MRAASTVIVIGSTLLFSVSSAHALGFGRITNATQLWQPLNFSAAVLLDADETLARECVSAEVFAGENKLAAGAVRVTLEGPESGDRSVRVTTSSNIDEPVVTVGVTVGCAAKVTRKFVLFIDPPVVNLAQSAPSEALPAQRIESQVAPVASLVEPNAPARAAAPRKVPSPRPQAPRVRAKSAAVAPKVRRDAPLVTVPSPPTAAQSPELKAAASARPAASGPRLELETAPAVVARAGSAAASGAGALPGAAGSASSPALTASSVATDEQIQREKERQRMALLEQGMTKLLADAQATQQTLVTLQARLKEAESQRYANPLVYALAWLSALLALAVAALWWRQSRASHAAQWWSGPGAAANEPSANQVEAATAAAATGAPTAAIPVLTSVRAAPPVPEAFGVSTLVDDEPPGFSASTRNLSSPFGASVGDEPPRELSVEELIDLEQQAEFFSVLGQDEAAIDLLMNHVRNDGGISPLPYLKLLEIYRRLGDRDAYERIRDRFNRRFNAYAPDWDTDLQQGRTLVDYPGIIERLQGLWVSPTRAMETLDASLFRRNRSDETFDLPAYRELLFLYSIARDLAEHGIVDPQADVDLWLPISTDPTAEPISRLMVSRPAGDFQSSEVMTMPLDLDVSLDGPADRKPAPGRSTHVILPAAGEPRAEDPDFAAGSAFLDLDLPPPAAKLGPTGSGR